MGKRTVEETLRDTPFRKNVKTILVSEAVGDKTAEVYSISVESPEQTASELTDFLRQAMESGTIQVNQSNRVSLPNGTILNDVHDEILCEGKGCAVHHPSEHHMRKMTQVWSKKQHAMMRECSHGVTHPDPDERAFRGPDFDWDHACCGSGCCHKDKES